jgi:hypothetical protein
MIYKNKLVTLKNLILQYRVPVKCQKKRETKYTETERNEMKRSYIYQYEAKRKYFL